MRSELFARVLVALVVSLSLCTWAHAEEPDSAATGEARKSEPPTGILPVPEHGGSIWERAYLTGDWGGSRTALAEYGIQFDVNIVQYVQGVADGGLKENTEYLGNVTYKLHLDLMRMGLLPGALIYVRGDTRFGDTVNAETGALFPANTGSLWPVDYSSPSSDVDLAITNLSYIQFLSEQFGVVVGKLDTFDGDPNEFASGRGVSQFMNWNLAFVSQAVIVPGSTLGAGVIALPNEWWTLSSLLLSAKDSSTSNGFNDLDEGGISATEARVQYSLFDRPGGANAYFLYFFDKDFADLDSFLSFEPGVGLEPSTEEESWIVGVSVWQYLFTEEEAAGPLNVMNGEPDLQGWGLFGRLGFAEEDTNPFKTAVSVGVGGRGVIPTRDDDVFGLGYFYVERDAELISDVFDIDDDKQGFEAFYNIAITPAARLSFDLQVLDSALSGVDTATVLGSRLNLVF